MSSELARDGTLPIPCCSCWIFGCFDSAKNVKVHCATIPKPKSKFELSRHQSGITSLSMVAQTHATSAPLGLPANLFWDVNATSLDVENHAGQIIGRVVELGRLQDWHAVRRHYGDQCMSRIVTQLRCLSPQAVSLCCAAFDLKPEDFRCCTARPFPQTPWIY